MHAPPELPPWADRLLRGAGPQTPAQERGAHLLRVVAADDALLGLAAADIPALLVKGAALARTHYSPPWLRPMCDIDVLVPRAFAGTAGNKLSAMGWHRHELESRPLTGPCLGESMWLCERVGASLMLEVHTHLDKLIPRAVDVAAIFHRARPLENGSRFRVPSDEDHALLVVQHAAGHGFRHAPAWVDLHLILSEVCTDWDALLQRAQSWGLSAALHVMLRGLRNAGSLAAPDSLLGKIAPSRAQALALRAILGVPSPLEVPRVVPAVTLQKLVELGVARDDFPRWARGLAGYGARRLAERCWW